MTPKPIYTPQNCKPAFKLYWTLSIFWKEKPIPAENWLDALKPLTEKDGVRILEYRHNNNKTSQFLLSTQPRVSPSNAIRSIKGRLQHQIRAQIPKAFKGNYSIKSVGSAKLEVVQRYLNSQLEHHKMADPKVQARFSKYQFDNPKIDLVPPRYSAHGQFIYNLHLVFVHKERWREIRDEQLVKNRDMIQHAALKKGHLLSKVSILPDHIHMTLGCDVKESPLEVSLGYLNNLSYAYEMRPVFQYGFYAGTFGEYDLGAIRQAGGSQS